MKEMLYYIVEKIASIHNKLLALNDAYEYNFNDKQLHFLIMGLIGMAAIFILHPLFLYLAKKGHIMTITWLFVFSLMVVLTFAIEIGQGISHTGTMDFGDIASGMFGFLIMFAVFDVLRIGIKAIIRIIKS